MCDDSREDIETLKGLAEQFALAHDDIPMRFSTFGSAEELLEHIETDGGFDLYILDVIMSEMTGIRLAQTLRGRDDPAEIVFLTISPEYAVDAFSVFASGYMIKPVSAEDFNKTILRAVQKISREKNETLTLKTRDGLRRIPLNKIVMVESFNHMREITLSDSSVLETPTTLSELFELLSDYDRFFMPHRSYIANLDYLVGIVSYDLLMSGDHRIPVPKAQFASVQEFVQNYLFKART